MKKVFVVALVCAMASLANAGLVNLSSTTPYVITFTAADAATDAAIYIDYTPLVAAGIKPVDATLIGSGASIANVLVFTADVEGADVFKIALGSMAAWSNGAALATLDLNGSAANVGNTPVVLSLIDGETGAATGQTISVMVNAIPEPATMALLGLGGLFFARKK